MNDSPGWQWCNDWDGDYPASEVTDPTGPSGGTKRILRGGSYQNVRQSCRAASRRSFSPDHRFEDIGFRVCMDL